MADLTEGVFFLYLLLFFTSFLYVILFTPFYSKYLIRNGIVDRPGERRVNEEPTPRMGGFILFAVFLLQTLSFYPNLDSIRLIVIGAIAATITGVIDDIKPINWQKKFVGQFIAAIAIVFYFEGHLASVELFGAVFPKGVDIAALLIFIVGGINSINFMDGLDGLVTGYSLFFMFTVFALALFLQAPLILFISVIFIGALLGFLKYNTFPAKIFLGDTGSLFLGFFLVLMALLVSTSFHPGKIDLTLPVLLLAVPLIDAVKVILIRLKYRRNPFLPDKNHLHHVVFRFMAHKNTVFLIHTLSMGYYVLALFYIFTPLNWLVIVPFGAFSVVMLLINSLLPKVSGIKRFYRRLTKYTEMPYIALKKHKTFIIGLSFIALFISLVSVFPYSIELNDDILFLLMGVEALIILGTLFHFREDFIRNHIYVFFNMFVFFILYAISNPLADNASGVLSGAPVVFQASFTTLTLFVISIFLLREKITVRKTLFFSGFDLTIVVLIFLSFLLQNFVELDYLPLISASMMLAFIVNLWYKIITGISENYKKTLFYSTFIFPVIAIIAAI